MNPGSAREGLAGLMYRTHVHQWGSRALGSPSAELYSGGARLAPSTEPATSLRRPRREIMLSVTLLS